MDTFEQARQAMIDGQLRPNEINNHAILAAMRSVPREVFVMPENQAVAYADTNISLANGGVMVAPVLVARLLQAAQVKAGDYILVTPGLGGYVAALLDHIGCQVVSMEPTAAQAQEAEARCRELKAKNIRVVTGNPTQGYAEAGPYQAIIIPGGVEVASRVLPNQLVSGGRLVTILRSSRQKSQVVSLLNNEGNLSQTIIADGFAPILPGFSQEVGFVF